MKLQKKSTTSAPGIPQAPNILVAILSLADAEKASEDAIEVLLKQYPQYFAQLLTVLNSSLFSQRVEFKSIYQAMHVLGCEEVIQVAVIKLVYQTCNQYKIQFLDMQVFWQDCLYRAVSAKKIGELIGLDAQRCFNAGFIQDIGFLMLFFYEPQKAALWKEFRKREPAARLAMEKNVFKTQHLEKLNDFLQSWHVFNDLAQSLIHHHPRESTETHLTEMQIQMSQVLHCADWISAVYVADDKSHVINRSREILLNTFELDAVYAEALLESIPDDVSLAALALDIPVRSKIAFSQILLAANTSLNKDNLNYQELTSRLDLAIAERDKLSEEINRDLNLAREIQQSLLPKDKGADYPLHGINLSAKALSGDFYDYFERENGDIYFNLGDVSGKGVNAALLMAKTSSLFRCLGKRIYDPARLMYEVNNELCETAIHGMFVTMVAGLYSPSSNTLQLVNAGNPPALLFLDGGLCQEFEATAPPLGVISHTEYSKYTINLQQGSLYIYSDGVTEGYTETGSMFELSGLFKYIAQMGTDLPAAERLKKIVRQFTDTKQALRDDVTLLVLENKQKND